MYAMVKKVKVSPVIVSPVKLTRLANGLGLLDNANIAYITMPRRVIDYSFFHHAHILKMRNRKIVMMYKGYTNGIELPDRSLGLYVVENFVLELQKPGREVGRSPSACITRNQNPRYQGEDGTPPEPAFTIYFGFDQSGSSYARHHAWEDHTPYESETSAGARWGPGNFDHYHPQDYEETMSSVQRGHMSFSTQGIHDKFHRPFLYHAPQDYYQPTPQHHHQPPHHHHHPPPPMGYDEPGFYQNVDNRLTSLEAR
jgi:hypothetical protein